jgi:hypothetical protein
MLGGSARVHVTVAMVIGEAVRGCGQRCSSVRWPELMVEVVVVVGTDDGGGVHACMGPTSSSHMDGGAP